MREAGRGHGMETAHANSYSFTLLELSSNRAIEFGPFTQNPPKSSLCCESSRASVLQTDHPDASSTHIDTS